MNKQKGYIKIVLVVFALLIGVMIFPLKFPVQQASDGEASPAPPEIYCRDMIDDPQAPTIEAPSYTESEVLLGNRRTYRLIKQNVAIDRSITLNQTPEHHYFPDFKEQYTDPQGQNYLIRIPQGLDGRSYKLPSEVGTEDSLKFADYGLVYLFHADSQFEPIIDRSIPKPGAPGEELNIVLADIYKAVDLPPLPDWVRTCFDQGVGGTTNSILGGPEGGVYQPPQESSPDKEQLQLEWFLFTEGQISLEAWWVPHCKPAVYLYPKQKQLVNVQVKPLGELGYTDPLYPKNGWTVTAYPDGTLKMPNIQYPISNSQYDYLYYETKLRDEEIRKPKYGWMVKGRGGYQVSSIKYQEETKNMEQLFDEVLPKLGLNAKEKADFEEYWLKTLPESPYYFVGLVEKNERDRLEELLVTPKPDTSIRFSLYFEPLENPVSVPEPVIDTPKREGFTLVDWGGLIKLHKDTAFTCSQ